MAIEHLNDSILQNYLDNNLGDKKSEIITHLDSCPICQARLEQYQLLYNELEIDSIPALSPDFSKAVMSKIAQVNTEVSAIEADKRPVAVPAPIYALIGAFAAIASIIYFVDLGSLMNAFKVTALSEYFNRVFVSKVSSITSDLSFDFSLVLMVIATLIVIGGVDYIVRHYKHRTASFMV